MANANPDHLEGPPARDPDATSESFEGDETQTDQGETTASSLGISYRPEATTVFFPHERGAQEIRLRTNEYWVFVVLTGEGFINQFNPVEEVVECARENGFPPSTLTEVMRAVDGLERKLPGDVFGRQRNKKADSLKTMVGLFFDPSE